MSHFVYAMHSPADSHLILILGSIPSTGVSEAACLFLSTAAKGNNCQTRPRKGKGGQEASCELCISGLCNPSLCESFAFIQDLSLKCKRRILETEILLRLEIMDFSPRSETRTCAPRSFVTLVASLSVGEILQS